VKNTVQKSKTREVIFVEPYNPKCACREIIRAIQHASGFSLDFIPNRDLDGEPISRMNSVALIVDYVQFTCPKCKARYQIVIDEEA
jgi:hypothetical protein